MDGSNLSERLRFDMKFLLWRAEVYGLDRRELESRYQQLQEEYLALASGDQRNRIRRELSDWHLILSNLSHSIKSA